MKQTELTTSFGCSAYTSWHSTQFPAQKGTSLCGVSNNQRSRKCFRDTNWLDCLERSWIESCDWLSRCLATCYSVAQYIGRCPLVATQQETFRATEYFLLQTRHCSLWRPSALVAVFWLGESWEPTLRAGLRLLDQKQSLAFGEYKERFKEAEKVNRKAFQWLSPIRPSF